MTASKGRDTLAQELGGVQTATRLSNAEHKVCGDFFSDPGGGFFVQNYGVLDGHDRQTGGEERGEHPEELNFYRGLGSENLASTRRGPKHAIGEACKRKRRSSHQQREEEREQEACVGGARKRSALPGALPIDRNRPSCGKKMRRVDKEPTPASNLVIYQGGQDMLFQEPSTHREKEADAQCGNTKLSHPQAGGNMGTGKFL